MPAPTLVRAPCLQELLFYVAVVVFDYGGFMLGVVVWLVSMYYLIVYKLQVRTPRPANAAPLHSAWTSAVVDPS